MWLIAGLGNPGREYAGTRHNLGYDVVDVLARRWSARIDTGKFAGRYGKGQSPDGQSVVLLKPETFMNRSGDSVQAAAAFFKVDTDRVLVVIDDLALPAGQVRLRTGGSAGGHKGLADVARALGSDQVPRVRIGIGQPPAHWAGRDYVLSRATGEEAELLADGVTRAADAIECWIGQGAEKAMSQYNQASAT